MLLTPQTPIRLLLADDHEILRDGLSEAIDREPDMELVGQAENGRQALILVDKLAPDIVIMDISMPDLNGIEATRQLTKKHPELKIIALSMYEDRHYVLGMFKAGVCGYILKTNPFEQLAYAIRQVSAGHCFVSAQLTGILVKSAMDKDQDIADDIEKLTSREIEVLQLIAEGRKNDYMSAQLNISKRTIEIHRKNVRKKLKLNTVAELTRFAIKKGLTPL